MICPVWMVANNEVYASQLAARALLPILWRPPIMDGDGNFFTTFDKAPEYFEILPGFLNVDLQCEPTAAETQTENALVYKLQMIVRTRCSLSLSCI